MQPLRFREWFFVCFLIFLGYFSEAFALPQRLQALDLVSGKIVDIRLMSDSPQKKYSVLVFLSMNCPCSRSHQPILKKLHEDFSGDQFQLIGVHSNVNESVEHSLNYFRDSGLPFPVIQDEGGRIANELGAYKTPHAYILDPHLQIIYQGGVDNTSDASRATQHFVRDNLNQLKKGEKIQESKRRVLGCQILRSSSD